MSARIVVIGPLCDEGTKIRALEIKPGDAGALVNGDWRVSLTLWGGVLANATVIVPKDLEVLVSNKRWRTLNLLCPGSTAFEIDLPIPYGSASEALQF